MKDTLDASKAPVLRVTGPATAPVYSWTSTVYGWTSTEEQTSTIDAEGLGERIAGSVRRGAIPWNYFSLALGVIVVGVHFGLGNPILTIGLGSSGVICLGLLALWGHQSARFVLHYDLDDVSLAHAAQSVAKVGEALHGAQRLWEVLRATDNWDPKRNAGASQFIDRKRVRCARHQPRWLECNIDVWVITSGDDSVVLLPDCMLMISPVCVVTAPYSKVSFVCEPAPFVEDEGAPRDAEVIGTTWQYVNKSGGPDLRFNDNRQLPKVLYGELTLGIEGERPLAFQVSNLKLANAAEAAFASVLGLADGDSMESDRRTRTQASKADRICTSAEIIRRADTDDELDVDEIIDALGRDFGSVMVSEDVSSLVEPLIAMRELDEELSAWSHRTLRGYPPEHQEQVAEILASMSGQYRDLPMSLLEEARSHAYEMSEASGPQQAAWAILANEIDRILDDPTRLRRFDEARVMDAVEVNFASSAVDAVAGSHPPSAMG